MKILFVILSIYSASIFAQGRYSNSDKYVICDIPIKDYNQYKELGYFETESLYKEGFIHCAKPNQLEYVMNKYFKDDSYVLFVAHKNTLGFFLKYEGKDPSNLYPHLYRRFTKKDSIDEVIVSRGNDGVFKLPTEFQKEQKMCIDRGGECNIVSCCDGLACVYVDEEVWGGYVCE